MEHQTNHTQAMDIELLKRDVKSLTELCTKFDNTIDSLQGIAADLSTMVKLQEQRLVIQEKVTDNLEDSLRNSRKEMQQETKELRDDVKERLFRTCTYDNLVWSVGETIVAQEFGTDGCAQFRQASDRRVA